jgi:hypothetical protein
VRSQVEHPIRTRVSYDFADALAISQVSDVHSHVFLDPIKAPRIAIVRDEDVHLVPGYDNPAGKRRADEARSPRNEDAPHPRGISS